MHFVVDLARRLVELDGYLVILDRGQGNDRFAVLALRVLRAAQERLSHDRLEECGSLRRARFERAQNQGAEVLGLVEWRAHLDTREQ